MSQSCWNRELRAYGGDNLTHSSHKLSTFDVAAFHYSISYAILIELYLTTAEDLRERNQILGPLCKKTKASLYLPTLITITSNIYYLSISLSSHNFMSVYIHPDVHVS